MFTEPILREYPEIIKAFMGIPSDVFWHIVEVVAVRIPEFDQERLARSERKRNSGAGRKCSQPIALRIAGVLTYLRLHTPQLVIAKMYGLTQPDISRDLRRVLPAIQSVLPCPQVWKILEDGSEIANLETVAMEQLVNGRALVDATEQRVSRPGKNEVRKQFYSGKKKQFTLKTQFLTDDEHHIQAISESVPGAEHDKTLSDELQTVERLPDGCELEVDKGYQGIDKLVKWVDILDMHSGEKFTVARLTVRIPYKKPKGGELTDEQRAFNSAVSAIRVRIEHCIGWVKNWAILATRFRCAHSIYTAIMRTICGLVNLQTHAWQAAKFANSA